MNTRTLAAVLLSLSALTANAQDANNNSLVRSFWNGNQMYEFCSKSDDDTANGQIRLTACNGYIAGVVDTYFANETVQGHWCLFTLPKAVTLKQLHDVVTNYLREHAEIRHYSAYSVVVMALQAGFPCR
jgi:hypothetical protein